MEAVKFEKDPINIDEDHKFSYGNLSKYDWTDLELSVVSDGYEAYVDLSSDKGFVRIKELQNEPTKSSRLQSMRNEGEKMHISIFDPTDENQNLSKAWSIVAEKSIEYGIKLFKIVRNEYRNLMRSSDKYGKEITWYSFLEKNDVDRIQAYLTDITIEFVKQGIIPGAKAIHDTDIVHGSNYFSFRNDGDIKNESVLSKIIITVEHQPDRKLYNAPIYGNMPEKILMKDDANSSEIEYNQNEDEQSSSSCSRCCRTGRN